MLPGVARLYACAEEQRLGTGQMRGAAVVIFAIGVMLGAGGCGGAASIDRNTAIQNVVNTIDGGPSWETQTDSQAVAGYLKFQRTDNGNDGGGGCAWVNGKDAEHGFACYLQESTDDGGAEVYFRESGDGSKITPIGSSEYSRLVEGGGSDNSASSTTTTEGLRVAKAARPPSRVPYRGAAPAIQIGPATDQSSCGQSTYTVGADISCEFGGAVTAIVHEGYKATGHYPAAVIAHSTVTGKTYTLRCSGNWSAELVCSRGTAEVTVAISKPLATSSPASTGTNGSTDNAGSGSCSPKTDSGGCYEPGEFCRADDRGVSGIAGDGEAITCEDNDGWRWEPS